MITLLLTLYISHLYVPLVSRNCHRPTTVQRRKTAFTSSTLTMILMGHTEGMPSWRANAGQFACAYEPVFRDQPRETRRDSAIAAMSGFTVPAEQAAPMPESAVMPAVASSGPVAVVNGSVAVADNSRQFRGRGCDRTVFEPESKTKRAPKAGGDHQAGAFNPIVISDHHNGGHLLKRPAAWEDPID